MINPRSEIKRLRTELLRLYSDKGEERCGFILPNKIIEVKNIAPEPEEGFMIDPSDIVKYVEQQDAFASWHTHPNYGSNLSGEDYRTFKAYNNLYHFIVGKDGVRCFAVEGQAVVEVMDE